MRICHVTTVHDWNDVRIFVKMCRSAASDGLRVDLIAPVRFDNPVTNSRDLTVHALRKYRSRIARASLGTIRAIRRAIRVRAAVYHIHDPELLPLVLTLRLLQRRVVFDFHEEFSADIKGKPYLGPRSSMIASNLARCWEFLLCLSASRIITATPRIRDRLPIQRTASAVVHNYPSLEEFDKPTRTPFEGRSRAAYYVGGITKIRGCFETIEAARVLKSSGTGIEIRIAGPFENVDLERALKRAATGLDVALLGRRKRQEVRADLEDARVGIVLFKPHPNHCFSLPNKIFEYMAAGIAVVASDFPLWIEIVARSGCGVTVNPQDPEAIARAISDLVEDPTRAQEMGRTGRLAVERRYHWGSQWEILRRVYRELVW